MNIHNYPKNRFSAPEKYAKIGTVLLGLLFACLTPSLVAEEELEDWEKAAENPNIIIFGAGRVSVDGDEAQFLAREGVGKDTFGGLEYLLYNIELEKDLSAVIEAVSMLGNEDYLIRIRLTKEAVGFLEFGHKSSREWFDGTGGYDPINDISFHYFDEQMSLDRGALWIAGQYSSDEDTVFNFKYSRKTRDGMKGTTRWADATLENGDRKNIVPGFFMIDEVRNTFQVDLDHHDNKADINVGLVYETNKQENSRNHRRRPGESADRYVKQSEDFDTDWFNGHTSVSYKVNDKVRLSAGTSYTTMDTVLNGSRTINGEFSSVFDPTFSRQNRDHGFLNLDGDTNMTQWVLNANAEFRPSKHFQIVPSIRFESQDTDSHADVLETNSNGTTDSFTELQPFGNSYWDDISAQIDVIYRGLPNWVFTGTLYGAHGEGDISEREIDVELAEVILERQTRRDRKENKITLSAKYYPQPGLNYSLNFYHKNGENDFNHNIDPTPPTGGNRLPAFYENLDFTTDDANFRVSWRPNQKLSMVSRVDYQLSKINMKGASLDIIESGRMKTRIFSQAFTYIPNQKWFVQASYTLVSDSLDTPANELTGVDSMLVPDANSDYWQADLSANLILNDKQTLLFRLFHYESDGYIDNSSVSQPYGFSDNQTSFTVTGRQKINERTTLSIEYGFYDLSEIAQGGLNDYQTHMVYCRWENRF
jgi:hypothetical protein